MKASEPARSKWDPNSILEALVNGLSYAFALVAANLLYRHGRLALEQASRDACGGKIEIATCNTIVH